MIEECMLVGIMFGFLLIVYGNLFIVLGGWIVSKVLWDL